MSGFMKKNFFEKNKTTLRPFFFSFHPLFCHCGVGKLLHHFYVTNILMVYKELNLVELVALVRILSGEKMNTNLI